MPRRFMSLRFMSLRAALIVILLGSALFETSRSATASATISARCELLSAPSSSGGDLRIQGDQSNVAVAGNVRSADLTAVRQGVAQLQAARREVCATYRIRTDSGTIDPSVTAQFAFLLRLHGGDSVDVKWGGGGITVAGWLHDDSLDALQDSAQPGDALDLRSVGHIDSLPLPVALKVEFVRITSSEFVQFEQFHPRLGRITMETSSVVWLEACPGGWRGETPPDASWGTHWPAGTCISFRRGSPAKLPDAWRSDTHLSVAVKAKRQVAANVDVTLRFTAVEPSGQCFIARIERFCQPFPRS